jgi:hypothetical protein
MATYRELPLRRAAKSQESGASIATLKVHAGGDCGRGVLTTVALTKLPRNVDYRLRAVPMSSLV